MYRTGLSILLLLLLNSIPGCTYYSFTLGNASKQQVNYEHTVNMTNLRGADMLMDSYLEKSLTSRGMLSNKPGLPVLHCTIISSDENEITDISKTSTNRYRVFVHVKALLKDSKGNTIWQSEFSDQGTYSSGGQEEDALDSALSKIADRIASSIPAVGP